MDKRILNNNLRLMDKQEKIMEINLKQENLQNNNNNKTIKQQLKLLNSF